MAEAYRALLFADLDETLISHGKPLSAENAETIRRLADSGIGVIAASGRTPMLFDKVLPRDLPLAGVICSTGSAVMEWTTHKILWKNELDAALAGRCAGILREAEADFMVFDPLPDNHFCRVSIHHGEARADFIRRRNSFDFTMPPLPDGWQGEISSQILAIFDPGEEEVISRLAERLSSCCSVVRATSPIDHQSLWLELFAPGVNKGSAAAEFHRRYAPQAPTYAIGNDYNDLAMLHWADHALAAQGSPAALTDFCPELSSPPETCLAEAIRRWNLL